MVTFVIFNLRGLVAAATAFGLAFLLGRFLEAQGLIVAGTADGGIVVFGAFACSLFGFATDRCDSRGVLRAYWTNLHQACHSAFGHAPGGYYTYNPARRTALFVFPLAFYPHVLTIFMLCFVVPGLVKGKLTSIEEGLYKYLPMAAFTALMATVFGYATSNSRLVPAVAPPSKVLVAARASFQRRMRVWLLVFGVIAGSIFAGLLYSGRPFPASLLLSITLGTGPWSIIMALTESDNFFRDSTFQHLHAGAFSWKGPAAVRPTLFLVGACVTVAGILILYLRAQVHSSGP